MTPERAAVEAAWLSLLSLPGVGPGRLWDIAVDGDPIGTWKAMSTGAPPAALSSTAEQRAAWRSGAAAIDPESLVEAHAASGITVTLHGDRGHPSIDQRDPHVPPVLLWRGGGSPAELTGRPSVGIIGTRRATRAGVSTSPSRSGSSPTASRISRTARSMRAWSTVPAAGFATGSSSSSPH